MGSKEIWNIIVKSVKDNIYKKEEIIQAIWNSTIFPLILDGSDCKNIEQVVPEGSTKKMDIVIKQNGNDVAVVELKQHTYSRNAKIGLVTPQEQLFSYLNQLKCVNIGILVCDKLYIYNYDFTKNDEENATNCLEIPFEKDSELGVKFVELFSKENFSEENIKEFIAQKIRSAQNIKNLREEIGNAKEMVIEFLENEFAPKYGKAEFDEVMNEFEIQIVKKAKETSVAFAPKAHRAIVHAHYDDGESTFSKSDAIKLCRKNGFANSGEITFSSTNKGNGVFWSNPNVRLLSEDLWLLLNDKEEKKLYVLFIPKKSINVNELIIRGDKQKLIDLQIKNDGSFVDSRSKYSFKKYLKTSIKY